MSKKKLFVVSDATVVPTGFGRVAEAVLDRLYETGEWDIKQLGVNYYDQTHDKPYRIYAAAASHPHDWLGFKRIRSLYEDVNPDVVWLFQDFWHLATYIVMSPEMRGLVTYFPVDSPNVKPQWGVAQAAALEVCTYTQFAAKEMAKSCSYTLERTIRAAKEQGKDKITLLNMQSSQGGPALSVSVKRLAELTDPANYNVIPHGIDTSKFYPADKATCRQVFNFSEDWFLVGNVNRNQSRKRQDLTIWAFSLFAKDKPNARLLLHDSLKTQEGWDLQQLAQYYGVEDKVLISTETFDNATLNALYNSLDVSVNTGGGEGWGLTSSESACCKVPQIVPNWSATAEIWKGSAILLDILSVTHEKGKINTAQCVIDHNMLAASLEDLYAHPEKRLALGEAAYTAMTIPQYNWDAIATQFNEIFHRAAEKEHVRPQPYYL